MAYIRGDMDTYLGLIVHADDYTLMPPFGGDTVRGFDHSPDAIARQRDFFGGGDATVELQQSYVSGRPRRPRRSSSDSTAWCGRPARPGLVPAGDARVFRRSASGWKMAHRHA